jgi:hypothetical protein
MGPWHDDEGQFHPINATLPSFDQGEGFASAGNPHSKGSFTGTHIHKTCPSQKGFQAFHALNTVTAKQE